MKIKLKSILKRLYLFVLLLQFVSINYVSAAAIHPNIFIDADEIAAIEIKIGANEEPWISAYAKMIEQADLALDAPLMSVTFGGFGNADNNCLNIRYFCVFGPDNWYDSTNGARPMGAAVRDLGMAYAFTGDEDYAIKLIALVKTWALDPVTGMIPRLSNGQSIISLLPVTSSLVYGVELSWDSPNWTQDDKDAFKSWVLSLGNSAVYAFGQSETNQSDNNFENWRNAFLSVAGAFTGDEDLLNRSYTNFRRAITSQVHCEGIMNQEYGRPERWGGTGYSLYAMHAMTITAEVARRHGVNLYDYATTTVTYTNTGNPCGEARGLKKALDYHAPFYAGIEPWPNIFVHGPNPLDSEHGMGIYELAYSVWQESQYLEVVNEWVRPLGTSSWPFGVVTLTHANQFDLELIPIPPSIMTQPKSVTVMEGEDASFSVVAIGDSTLVYQWFRDSELLSGATTNSYTEQQVSANYDGARYHCEITNDLGSIVSNEATLTVLMDTVAPTIDSGFVPSVNQVDIRFSESITLTSAQTVANYQIDQGIQILSASLNADNKTVHLQTDTLELDVVYTVTVSDIEDISAATNQILAGSSVEVVFAPVMNFDNGQLPFGWIPLTVSRWSVIDDGGNNVLFLNTTIYNPLSGLRLGEHIISSDNYGDFTLTVEAKTNEDSTNGNADYALVFGFENAENYFYMLFNRTMSNTQLFKVVNGTRQELGTATASISDDQYHTVEVRRATDNIEVRFDGSIVLEIVDSSFPSGRLGLGSFNDSAYFDDVRITGNSSIILSDLIFSSTFE